MAPHRMGEAEAGEPLVVSDMDVMTPKAAKDRITQLDSQLEMVRKELSSATEEASKREERLLMELDTTRKLAELYKEKADEASVKSTDLMSIIKAFETHMYQREAQFNAKLQQEVEAREVAEKDAKEAREKLEEELVRMKEESASAKAAVKVADESTRETAVNGLTGEQRDSDGGLNAALMKTQDSTTTASANKEGASNRREAVDACSRQHLFPGESVSEEDEQLVSCPHTPGSSEAAKDNEDEMYASISATSSREYPPDPSLPDIKNSIYGTDEFRMFSFKVRPCSRAYSHDWTECPFVHPGENARRRDPRRYHYSCVPCPDFRKGACRRGDNCEYAHGVFECWLHPAQYRTRLCKDGTGCARRVCFFAHTSEELRPVYTATGSAIPSPRSASPMDMRSVSLSAEFPPMSPSSVLMMSQFSQNSEPFSLPTPPMSPSGASSGGANQWSQSSSTASALHLGNGFQASRLRAAIHARDIPAQDEIDAMMALQSKSNDMDTAREAEQFVQHARLAAVAASAGLSLSPRAGRGGFSGLGLQIPPSPQAPEDYFGPDPSQMPSPVRSPLGNTDRTSQFVQHSSVSSPTSMRRLNSEQLLQQYLDASIPPSHGVHQNGMQHERGMSSPGPFSASGAQQSAVAAALNARRSPAPRTMWRERDHPPHMGGGMGGGLPPLSVSAEWGSPTGKPDWGMPHEEPQMRRGSGHEDDSELAWLHRQRMKETRNNNNVDSEAAVAAALAASAGGSMAQVMSREKGGERERMLMSLGGGPSWMDQTA